jgi:hypothetical protein
MNQQIYRIHFYKNGKLTNALIDPKNSVDFKNKITSFLKAPEDEVEAQWDGIKERMLTITHGQELGITKDDQDAVSALINEMKDLI